MKKILAAFGLFFLAGVFVGFGLAREGAVVRVGDNRASGAASIMLDYGDGTIKVYPSVSVSSGDTAFDALKRAAEADGLAFGVKEYPGLGTLVERIGEKKNGDAGKYWQYWANNVSPPVGADQYVLKPGDVMEWKFLKYSGQ